LSRCWVPRFSGDSIQTGEKISGGVVNGDVQQLTEVALEDIGFRERWDLQRWIEDYPEIVGPDLLVVTTEFDRWEVGSDRVRDRLDVLFLDSSGSLVVAELDTLEGIASSSYCG
jgi:hypothetical protein